MNTAKKTFVVLIAYFLLPTTAQADLQPNEIAIIAVRGNKGSERLAEYYAEQRSVPKQNICTLVMPKGETLSHEKWIWTVRPETRKWLVENDPDRKLRCLVTTWGVPLRIEKNKQKFATASRRYHEYLRGERSRRLSQLQSLIAKFKLLAADENQQFSEPVKNESGQGVDLKELQQLLESELQQAQQRILLLADSEQQKQANVKLQQYATSVGGMSILMKSIQRHAQSDDPTAVQAKIGYEHLRGMALAYGEVIQKLNQTANSIQRDTLLLDAITRTGGLIASVEWIDQQLGIVRKNETNSSFDSELSLVLWPEDYQQLRWQTNYLAASFDDSQLRESFPTLMVARIDAPTLKLAKSLIDTAIKIENEGLQGKVYLDARGIGKLEQANVSPGSYADFDRALLIMAKRIQEKTSLEVVLNTEVELFQDGDCPNAALYCGWYSLGNYVDAFEWVPGAVAYHLASGEATTLHKKDSQVWCKRMLEEGVCATIGPVYEPYLIAFPRPNEFFGLLLEGELSLVECYYRTKPFNSWMMTLIGDPLYRPFVRNSPINSNKKTSSQ